MTSKPQQESASASVALCEDHLPQPLDANKLRFSGPSIEIAPLRIEYLAILWSTTMMNNPANQRLFHQVYGTECESLHELTSTVEEGRSTGTHIPLMVTSHGSTQPSNWSVMCTPQNQGDSLLYVRFLENTLRVESHLESNYLINCHVFEDLHHDSIRLRQGTLPKDHPIQYERSLLASLRRTLFVPEESEISDLFIVTKHNWLATKVATAAWLGIDLAGDGGRAGLSI